MLSLESLCFSIPQKTIFRDISLSLLPASITYLTGQNGSGKTSLLRMLAGIQQPSKGKIIYLDQELSSLKHHKPYCTYVGHKLGLKQELSVIDNLQFWAEMYDSAELVGAAISVFNLQEYRHKKCYELSAGTQKRVALARLIACQSKLWLLDEIDTNLDKDNRKIINNLIITHANNGGIAIISSHNNIEIKTAITIDLSEYS